MATAAHSIGTVPAGVEAGTVTLPGTAELFAALVAGVNRDEASAEGTQAEAAPGDIGENVETGIDASVLLPMLDQQRAATPAAKLVGPAVESSSPVTCMIAPAIVTTPAEASMPASPADRIPVAEPIGEKPKVADIDGRGGIRPTPIDGKGATVAPVAPAKDPVIDATPVMRRLPGEKAAAAPVTDATPVMRPLQDGKAAPVAVTGKSPVMDAIGGSKLAAVAATDPTPAMRPIDSAALKATDARHATRSVKGNGPVAIEAAPALQINAASPTTTSAQVHADLAPKVTPPLTAAVQPQAAADVKARSPEMQLAAADAQAAPVAAKARTSRVPVAPVRIEATPEAAGTTVAATATETRAAVQPLHATPLLVQSLAAPAGAPVQNVAAALSQQVLDMSAGDAWIDQIARDISRTSGSDGAMRFRLAPETLGELKVEITHSERGAHVRMNVTSESAQQALAAAEPKLAAEARAQGVRIAETEISLANGQSQGREMSRQAQEQAQAQNGHPARTPRGTAATNSFTEAAEPSRSRRADRYA